MSFDGLYIHTMNVTCEALSSVVHLEHSLDDKTNGSKAETGSGDEDGVICDGPEDFEEADDRAVHLCGVLDDVLRVCSREIT